jgi:fluoroquinolone resistance protein
MNNITSVDRIFKGLDFREAALEKGEYEGCTFENCVFTNSDMNHIVFQDCLFESCDISMAQLKGTSLRDVKFKNCKMLGLRFDSCNPFLLSLTFEKCILDFSSFFRLNIKKTIFRDSKLEDVEFVEADLTDAVFSGSDLNRAVFGGTVLEKADFRGAYNYSLDPENNRIKKAKFSLQQAAGLLVKYNILLD